MMLGRILLAISLAYCSAIHLFAADSFSVLPPLSGMARLDASHYAVVIDSKTNDLAPRLGVLSVSGSPIFQSLDVQWGVGGIASDLESICAIPGLDGEFLAAESGYFEERYGRIFHIKIDAGTNQTWRASVLHQTALPKLNDEVEGIACYRGVDQNLILILGVRGTGQLPSRLVWGKFNVTDRQFKPAKAIVLKAPTLAEPNEVRDCTDLFLDANERFWISAAVDPGDAGPFWSLIYQVPANFVNGELTLKPSGKELIQFRMDGFKIEALSSGLFGTNSLAIGADDEIYGGAWRNLPIPLDRRYTRP